jgi:hypothetical protein
MEQTARRRLINDYNCDYYGGALMVLIGLAAADRATATISGR